MATVVTQVEFVKGSLRVLHFGSGDDLPESVRNSTDSVARDIFRHAYNSHAAQGRSEMHSYLKGYMALKEAGYERDGAGNWKLIQTKEKADKDKTDDSGSQFVAPAGGGAALDTDTTGEDIDDPGSQFVSPDTDNTTLHKGEPGLGDVHVDRPLGSVPPGTQGKPPGSFAGHLTRKPKKPKQKTDDSGSQFIEPDGAAEDELGKPGVGVEHITKRISGNSDIPLNDKGKKLATALGERIHLKGGLDVLYSSPLQRGVQTADLIEAENPGTYRAKPAPQLQPWHIGEYEGQMPDDVHDLIEHYIKHPDQQPPGKGRDGKPAEKFDNATTRQLDFLSHLYEECETHPTMKVGVIMHSRCMELTQAWVDAGQPKDHDVDYDDLVDPDDPDHADMLRWHNEKIKEVDVEDDDELKPGLYLILHSLTDDDTDEGNEQLEKQEPVQKIIRQEGGKWHVYSHDGSKHLGGPYGSKAEAVTRLRQVEYFKDKADYELEVTKEYNPDQPRDDHGRFGEGSGEVSYHGTSAGRAKKIFEEGLKAQGKEIYRMGQESAKMVFTSTDKETAWAYGSNSAKEFAVLTIDVEKGGLKQSEFEDDTFRIGYKDVPASAILRVEFFHSNQITPYKTVNKASHAYAVMVFDGDKPVAKYLPPDEVHRAAKSAYDAGTSIIGITAPLAEHEGLPLDEVRRIAEHFAAVESHTESLTSKNAWGGALAAKWAGRVMKKASQEFAPWIAVDFDNTLAEASEDDTLGAPIPRMVARVKRALAGGKTVKVFTARVAVDPGGEQEDAIQDWTEEHLGQRLDVTNAKDPGCTEIWDDKAVPIEKQSHDGVMLAFYPPPSVTEQVALAGGEDAKDLHITLAYFGKDLDTTKVALLETALDSFAASYAPLSGEIGGPGRFAASEHSDGQDVCIATFNSRSIQGFRRELVAALEEVGVDAKNNFGYTPHLTLQYIEPSAPLPVQRIAPIPITFDTLYLVQGGQKTEYKLAGATVAKYSPDQPRDWHGRFGSGGSGDDKQMSLQYFPGMALEKTSERAFNGQQIKTDSKLNKLQTGVIGEEAVLAYLQQEGHTDAHPLNDKANNFPVDMMHDHIAIEVKGGLVSNSKTAQQWRATIGQPGKTEREWLKQADKTQKREWNQEKQQKILERKADAVKELSKDVGHPVKGYTMTTIINHDTRTIDLYKFEGFHLRIPWTSQAAKDAYVGSFKYK